MTPDVPLYKITNLKYIYGERFQLCIHDLTIDKGASIGFVGPNGCGKSTLLRMLAFLTKPCEGDLYYDGAKVETISTGLRKDVTILLQEPYLLKRSVFENVAYGIKSRGVTSNLTERVYEALRLVGLSPDDFAHRKWYELSGGEAQRVSLASRLAINPKVLILDEPTANVDQRSASLIKDAIRMIRKKFKTSLVIASHDLVWLNGVTDRIYKMYNGYMVGSGTENLLYGPWELLSHGVWAKPLSGGVGIYATKPPKEDATASLSPSDIMISISKPDGISAQNILQGTIAQMSMENESKRVLIDVDVSGMFFTCRLTEQAVRTLSLLPGKSVWVVFKASSLRWYT